MADKVLEGSALDRLRSDVGDEVVAELIGLYIDDASELVATIREAAGGGDTNSLVRAAHTLKSTSEALGARGLAAACAELEKAGPESTLDQASTKVAHIEALAKAAQKALRAELRG